MSRYAYYKKLSNCCNIATDKIIILVACDESLTMIISFFAICLDSVSNNFSLPIRHLSLELYFETFNICKFDLNYGSNHIFFTFFQII